MRITFVIPYAGMAGGIRVIAIYADRLMRRGHTTTVVSVPQKTVPFRRKVKSLLLGRGWILSPKPEPSYFDRLSVSHHVIDCSRPITDGDVTDADVVVATWWGTVPWVAALSESKGAKAVLIQGYEAPPGEQNSLLEDAWRMPLHKIVISKWLKDLATTRFNDACVSHVPNSVDLMQFWASQRGKQNRPTVGVLYSTSPFKSFAVSHRAIESARQMLPELRIVAFGACRPTDDLPLPRGTEYTFRPPQEQIASLYAQCDAWLCGSCREGFHLPPLEAMACRCPVVSTRVGGPMDIIDEGVNGHLVDVGDADALADRLVRVLSLPEPRWRAMSDAAYATATRYTWDDATDLFEQALQTAIERSRRGELTPKRPMGVVA